MWLCNRWTSAPNSQFCKLRALPRSFVLVTYVADTTVHSLFVIRVMQVFSSWQLHASGFEVVCNLSVLYVTNYIVRFAAYMLFFASLAVCLAMWLRTRVFWDVMLCHWVIGSRLFDGTVPLSSRVQKSKKNYCQASRNRTPEERSPPAILF
jgi:hypothetical protein